MNSDRARKLRQDKWLISAILREINQLEGGRVPMGGIHDYIRLASILSS
jgi:hypothetical protein